MSRPTIADGAVASSGGSTGSFSLNAGDSFTITSVSGDLTVTFYPYATDETLAASSPAAQTPHFSPVLDGTNVTQTAMVPMVVQVAGTSWTFQRVATPVSKYFEGDYELATELDSSLKVLGTLTAGGDILTTSGKGLDAATASGFKIGKATTDRLGFWNATPGTQPTGSRDVLAGLVDIGLRAASSNPPLDLGTGAITCGTIAAGGHVTMGDAKNIILNTTTGTKIGTATSQKLGFFNATPVVQLSAAADLGTDVATLGLRASGNYALAPGGGTLAVTSAGVVSFFGAAGTDTQAAAIASPAANTTALKTAVDAIRVVLSNIGLTAP